MTPLKLALVQYVNRAFGRTYMPYSAALLASWLRVHAPGCAELLPLVYRREEPEQVAERLTGADVLGLSCYVWNRNLSLATAAALKRRRPEALVVVGGPHIPDRAGAFMREHPYVDVAVHGAGEVLFQQVLERASSRDFTGVPGISWRRAGEVISSPRPPRGRDLSQVPSPFLTGVLDELLDAHPEEEWIALWETNRGCPFSCTFCDWGSAIASKVLPFDQQRLWEEIDWFSRRKIGYIFCCDANFGILPRDLEIARRLVEVRNATGWPQEIYIQNTKNATERAWQVQSLLAREGMNKEVVLSLQTLDEGTLQAIRRENISLSHFEDLQRRFTAQGVVTYTDIILGLPGESYRSFSAGIGRVLAMGQQNRIKFYPLFVLPNSELGDPEYLERHAIQTVPIRLLDIQGPVVGERVIVPEYVDMVVETATMPRVDWIRARALSWMVGLVYFNSLLRVPMNLLHDRAQLPFEVMLERLLDVGEGAPTLTFVRALLFERAIALTHGEAEYMPVEGFGEHWLSPEDAAYMQLLRQGRLADLVEEGRGVLTALALAHGGPALVELLDAAVDLSRDLLDLPEIDPPEQPEVDGSHVEDLLARLMAAAV